MSQLSARALPNPLAQSRNLAGQLKEGSTLKNLSLGVGAAALVGAIIVGMTATPAFAVEYMKSMPGGLTCSTSRFQEQHISSYARGNVRHQLNNASGWTNPQGISQYVITAGYSATYTSWDTHFWGINKSSWGYAYGSTGITSASRYCS